MSGKTVRIVLEATKLYLKKLSYSHFAYLSKNRLRVLSDEIVISDYGILKVRVFHGSV